MAKYKIVVRLNDDGKKFILQRFKSYHNGSWFVTSFDSERILPEFKLLEGGWVQASATDVTAEYISKYDLEFPDPEAEVMYNYLIAVTQNSKQTAGMIADFKQNGVVPTVEHDVGMLSPYQVVGLAAVNRSPGYGLFMKQGTGKTPIAVMSVCHHAQKVKGQYRAIIVCPPNVRLNWQREFDHFSTEKVDCHIIRGSQINRISQLVRAIKSKERIVTIICNYETLQGSWDAISLIKFNKGILDEAQYIKSSKTKRWEFVKKLRDNCDTRLVLTGTPIANNIMDLWTLFEFMGEGFSGFITFDGFKKYFGQFRKSEHGDIFEQAQNLPILKDRIARFSYVVTKEEAMPYLPQKTYDVIEVEMEADQAEAYAKLRDELIIEVEAALNSSDNEALTVNNVLVQLLRLSQITSSFKVIPAVYDTEGGGLISPRTVIPFEKNIKVQAIIDLLPEKGPNDKTIIWSNWVEDIEAVAAALRAAGETVVTFYGNTSFDDRIEAERMFNEDPSCRWFIGNPAAGGTGLTLLGYNPKLDPDAQQSNCNHTIYMSKDWSALKREQSEDRGHRRGSRVPMRITDVMVPNTIDTVIDARVADKRKNANSVLDLREVLSDIRGALV